MRNDDLFAAHESVENFADMVDLLACAVRANMSPDRCRKNHGPDWGPEVGRRFSRCLDLAQEATTVTRRATGWGPP